MKKLLIIAYLWIGFISMLSAQMSVDDSLRIQAAKQHILDSFRTEQYAVIGSLRNDAAAAKMKIPAFDHRGLWINFVAGRSNTHTWSSWSTKEICDCEGKLIKVDTIGGQEMKRALSVAFQFEYRLKNRWGIRTGAQYKTFSIGAKMLAKDELGRPGTLSEAYQFQQQAINTSLMYYLTPKHGPVALYVGVDASWRKNRYSGGMVEHQPVAAQGESLQAQYTPMEIDRTMDADRWNMGGFIGIRTTGKRFQVAYETGWNQTRYKHFVLTIPLSKRIKKSRDNFEKYAKPYREINWQINARQNSMTALERQLFPERFVVTPETESSSSDSGSSDSGSSSSGSSGSGSCSGGSSNNN